MRKKKVLEDQIDALKKEQDDVVKTVNALDIGSDEHRNAVESVEKLTKATCEMIKTQEEVKTDKSNRILGWVKGLGELLLGAGGALLYCVITRDEAIDEAGGYIPSQAVKEDRRAAKSHAIRKLK